MTLPAHFGWYDRADQTEPTHEPGPDAPCPFCGVRVGRHAERPICTMSIMGMDRKRSYFYRAHKDCYKAAAPETVIDIESVAIDGVN